MTIAFKIQYSTEATIQLKKLESKVAKRIIKKVESAQENPHTIFRGLSGRNEYKLRVGDYRVIADIDETNHVIFIMSLGHRKNIHYQRIS